jgi:NAD-dependent SIR2 family protein deacetylase
MTSAPLLELMESGGVVALTGAGMSTASGIPDYRGPNGAFTRNHKPMTIQEFVANDDARTRYWARAHAGWVRFSSAQPNSGHQALAELERDGIVTGVITQNVDGLHHEAGSRNVIELHGSLHAVICMNCEARYDRQAIHQELTALNPSLTVHADRINPDGDTEIPDEVLQKFQMVRCSECSGTLKPDVVYFGENVPATRVAESTQMVLQAQLLLVLGSTLSVFSGRRFIMQADREGIPIAVVNLGPTRADGSATLRIEAPVHEFLPEIAGALSRRSVFAAPRN